jgi:hypothetical protein
MKNKKKKKKATDSFFMKFAKQFFFDFPASLREAAQHQPFF